MDWTGFTDDQLRQLKRQTQDIDGDAGSSRAHHGRQQRVQMGRPRQQHAGTGQRSKMMPGQRQRHSDINEPISDSQKLSVPKTTKPRTAQVNTATTPQQRSCKDKQHVNNPVQADDTDKQAGSANEQKNDKVQEVKEVVHEIDEKEGISRELSNIEKIQKLQKEMEEENKRKKALLVKAVADRKKRTDAEMRKLKEIQKELTKIDGLISHDVAILRDKIEDASREYLDAQRRYEKAEAEFIASKINLHEKTELKDSLTEHLYSIIQENENRKASKLEELTAKLDVENLEDYYPIQDTHDAAIQSNDLPTQTTVTATSTATDSAQTNESASKNTTTANTTSTATDSVQTNESASKNTEIGNPANANKDTDQTREETTSEEADNVRDTSNEKTDMEQKSSADPVTVSV